MPRKYTRISQMMLAVVSFNIIRAKLKCAGTCCSRANLCLNPTTLFSILGWSRSENRTKFIYSWIRSAVLTSISWLYTSTAFLQWRWWTWSWTSSRAWAPSDSRSFLCSATCHDRASLRTFFYHFQPVTKSLETKGDYSGTADDQNERYKVCV